LCNKGLGSTANVEFIHNFYAVISFLFKSGMQVGAKMTSVRMVQVGGKYQMPPAAQGSPPSNFTGLVPPG